MDKMRYTLFFKVVLRNASSILGCLQYFFEKGNHEASLFEGIQKMYVFCIWYSSIYLTPLLMGFSIESTIELFKKLDYAKLSGIEDS